MPTLGVLIQHLLPRRTLSRLAGWVAQLRIPWIKNTLIRAFLRRYQPATQDSNLNPRDYPNFQTFFTRPLHPGRRPLPADPDTPIIPCDGRISQLGDIRAGRLLQAKGRDYSLAELLGDDADARLFQGGRFVTVYLSPRDYHRVHMPLGGGLLRAAYRPGRLFAVNPATTRAIPRLLARNERMCSVFATPLGTMAVILVGALLVSGVETVWDAHWQHGRRNSTFLPPQPLSLERGAQMGHFHFGSTAIVLFATPHLEWDAALHPNATVRMGALLGAPSFP